MYYTWNDPMKEHKLVLLVNEKRTIIELNESCGIISKESSDPIYYSIFDDGMERVLIVTRDIQIIESISDVSDLFIDCKE